MQRFIMAAKKKRWTEEAINNGNKEVLIGRESVSECKMCCSTIIL